MPALQVADGGAGAVVPVGIERSTAENEALAEYERLDETLGRISSFAYLVYAGAVTDPEIGRLGDYDSVSVILMTESGKHCTISNSRRATSMPTRLARAGKENARVGCGNWKGDINSASSERLINRPDSSPQE